jgi:hypothetical protein
MKKAAGVDNTARRKWDKDEFKKQAEDREKEEDVGRNIETPPSYHFQAPRSLSHLPSP